MIDENEYGGIPQYVIEMKDRLLKEVEDEKTGTIILALMSTLIEVIVTTAPSLESALETTNHLGASMTESIKACDHAGLCNWNGIRQ
jgi:hypothetical protein